MICRLLITCILLMLPVVSVHAASNDCLATAIPLTDYDESVSTRDRS